MGRLGLVEQAAISQRLKHICDLSYNGDSFRLSAMLGLKHSQVKNLLAGKIASTDYMQLILQRVPRLEGVCNVEWIRTGQGKPYGEQPPTRVVDVYETNGATVVDMPVVPNGEPRAEPPQTLSDWHDPVVPEKPTIVQIITRLSERIDRLEKTWSEVGHEARSLARQEVATACGGQLAEVGKKVEAETTRLSQAAEDYRTARAMLASIEAKVARVDNLFAMVARLETKVATLDAAATLHNNSLIDIGGQVQALEDAITRPGGRGGPETEPPPPPPPRYEASLLPDEYMSVAEYLACEFDPQDAERRAGLAAVFDAARSGPGAGSNNLTRYLHDACLFYRMPLQHRQQGRVGSAYPVAALRAVSRFVGPGLFASSKERRAKFIEHVMNTTPARA